MSSYKLVQFLKDYFNIKKVEVPIEIRLQTARTRVNKLVYKYKNISKDIFIDVYKQSDLVKNCANFFKVIKELKPYMIKFKLDRTMKPMIYPNTCKVQSSN